MAGREAKGNVLSALNHKESKVPVPFSLAFL